MILWINLVTNGLPALALGVDPPDPNQMRESPRPQSAGLLGSREYGGIVMVGIIMGGMAVLLYAQAGHASAVVFARNNAFTLLALSPLMHAFSCRSASGSVFSSKPFFSLALIASVVVSACIHLVAVLVPTLQPVFHTHTMSASEWITVLLYSLAIVPAMEVIKIFYRLADRAKTKA
jgi:Ca2+-transporting ATPase